MDSGQTVPTKLRRLMRLWAMVPAVLALLAIAGCQQTPPAQQATDSTRQVPGKIADGSELTPAAAAAQRPAGAPRIKFAEPPAEDLAGGKLVEETWDAISMQGKPVGYVRTIIANVKEGNRDLVRSSSFVRVVLSREGQASEQAMSFASWDTPDGEFLRFESRMSSGPSEIVVSGAVRDGQLAMDLNTLGQKQSVKLPWSRGWGGPFAVEQSLQRQPLKAGEKRTIHCLLAALNVPGDVQLEAVGEETVELPGGAQKLLKVKVVTNAGQHKIEELRWLDPRGETLKSIVPSLQQEAVRTTKADALSPASGEPLDLMIASTVPITGKLVPSATSKRAVYRAHVKNGQIAGLFSDCPSQRLKPIDDQTVELTVVAVRPEHKPEAQARGPAANDAAPTEADLQVGRGSPDLAHAPTEGLPNPPADADSAPSSFIQSTDPLIQQMAAQVAAKETDPWKIARALESFVQRTVKNKNYSQAFATAADVARSLEGDCTEHALLLAALCRARKIPARAAFGLIYYPPKHGFAYHMWTEVWIKNRWVPMDATLGLGGIGADHIKLGDSNFAGSSPLTDLLSVVQVLGRLELSVISID
jgi:hypothetical protein